MFTMDTNDVYHGYKHGSKNDVKSLSKLIVDRNPYVHRTPRNDLQI
jgi:hypothetical protein